VKRLTDIHELDKWGVPDRVKVICVQGNHALEPKKPSRSEWLYDAVCNLMRSNVPDEVIYSVITDPALRSLRAFWKSRTCISTREANQ